MSDAGEICVNTLKKDWKSSYGIAHILVTVKCLLIYPNPDSALDEEAGKLLQENYESYCERAKLITSVHATPKVRLTTGLYPPFDGSDKSALPFSGATTRIHEERICNRSIISTNSPGSSETIYIIRHFINESHIISPLPASPTVCLEQDFGLILSLISLR